MSFKKQEIFNNITDFAESIKEDYELKDVSVYQEQVNENTISFGFRIINEGKEYIAFIEYKKVNEDEYELPNKILWNLKHNESITFYHTIAQFMDAVFGV